jgi:hypothetical protein
MDYVKDSDKYLYDFMAFGTRCVVRGVRYVLSCFANRSFSVGWCLSPALCALRPAPFTYTWKYESSLFPFFIL